MEKFGLFDLIDKFSETAKGTSSFSKTDKKTENADKNSGSVLKNPDFGGQPQYMMNAKLNAFVTRHDALARKILAENGKK